MDLRDEGRTLSLSLVWVEHCVERKMKNNVGGGGQDWFKEIGKGGGGTRTRLVERFGCCLGCCVGLIWGWFKCYLGD